MYKRPLFVLLISIFSLYACTTDDETEETLGNWVEVADFDGPARSGAISFSIGNRAYVGLGYDGSDRLNDFWEYDQDRNFWVKRATFPGSARNAAVAFAANGKGYITTGYDGSNELKDFWEYDPNTDSWTQKADFPGDARIGAVAFSIDNMGYVGTGNNGDNDLKDFWKYDPASDTWTQIPFSGSKRVDAFAFVIDGMAYIGGGRNNGLYEQDFWQFDPLDVRWTELLDLDEDDYPIARENTVSFAINGKGYISTGSTGSALRDTYEYNPVADEWEQKTSLEGASREEAVAFVLTSGEGTTTAFVATGRSGQSRFDDVWQFFPDEEYDEED
ncbi:kelch repeat-containing protein [Porifericola rhodea]|uniref:Kelch repeat-containing protein n=1 Tax=Porifericola rhodea TaxID=930972 RepID=UPI002664EDD4|nr:kelch repeat-containing protein [Porifericola rhodea]WKN33885.1 kelch repeat-containing protein [Porifericola rhodea]